MALEKIKRVKDSKKLRLKRREHQQFLIHIQTCKPCALKWKMQHGGASRADIEEVTGKAPVNDTGIVVPAKHYLN